MKHLLVIFCCISALISCNTTTTNTSNSKTNDSIHKSIPPNSIYEEGDVVYELDSFKTDPYITKGDHYHVKGGIMRIDGFVIYRSKKNEVLFDLGIGKGAITEFIYKGKVIDTLGTQFYFFDHGNSNNASYMAIQNKWIFWQWEGEQHTSTHISSKVQY